MAAVPSVMFRKPMARCPGHEQSSQGIRCLQPLIPLAVGPIWVSLAKTRSLPQALRRLELTQCCSVCLPGPDRLVYEEVKVATFVSL
jgi:hypothetical protein